MVARPWLVPIVAAVGVCGSDVIARPRSASSLGGEAPEHHAFDPTGYLRDQELDAVKARAEARITTTNVTIDGEELVRLEASSGTIYVLKAASLRTEDLARGRCQDAFRPSDLQTAEVSAAEVGLTRDVAASATAFVAMIARVCASATPPRGLPGQSARRRDAAELRAVRTGC